uniref:LOW QUALITY PROTEIN: ATP-binding cassette sub-family F member 3-like n=1 Tax=Styela clava TaxID=7725 RepID=UPI001939C684|nr:LOW QUALITY PROTEIN: ATP-binding cassette sub-family F member 3-like [Styela clava]
MAAQMKIINKAFQIDDKDILDYIESVLENGASDFDSSDDVFEAVGEILRESCIGANGDIDQKVLNVCEQIYSTLSINDDEVTNGVIRLDAPVHLASMAEANLEDQNSASIWLARPDNKSFVDLKKLEKAESKIKQKQDKKSEKSINEKSSSSNQLNEATTSQLRSRRENKSEVAGTNKVVDLHIENFDIAFGAKVLLENADLHVAAGRRYGLVGRNGVGKTTLLKMMSTRNLHFPSHFSVLHVEQEVVGDDTNAIQSVLESDTVRESLLKEEKEIHSKLDSHPSDAAQLNTRLSEIWAKLSEIEADKAPMRAAVILTGLGFTTDMQKMTTKEFSGGWRMRLALARALFAKPDLLLLDEPTNMLDIRAIMWLEDYLQTWQSTVIVVSHDRSFLNSVATDILHMYNKKLTVFRGNFEQFIVTKDEKMKNLQKEYDAQKQYRDHIQIFIDRFRYNANRASQVQSKLKLLEKLPKLEPIEKETDAVMRFHELDERVNGTMIRLDEVSFHYVPEKEVFSGVDISASIDSRICIVGENGSGKSTLLKLLIEENEPKKGLRHSHRSLRLGYFSQHHVDMLEMDLNSVELMESRFPGKNIEEYRGQLGRYGITGDLALRSVQSLSGGQKSRLAFAIMTMTRPNFFILDEPTNHLDMETIEALGKALNKFKGGVILVSHDERLISIVCKELWLCGDKRVTCIKGGFEEYKEMLEKEFKRLGIKQ